VNLAVTIRSSDAYRRTGKGNWYLGGDDPLL